MWDVASALAVAALPGCRAIATASAAIAATYGYPDGEQIPVELTLDMTARIAAAVDLPVTADLEAGYGDVGETVRRAIAAGAVGGNLEDEMRPFDDAVAAVQCACATADREGVAFVLNARTDAFLLAGERDLGEVVADAVQRGRAFLDAGAACVFVPGMLGAGTIAELVDAFGSGKLSVLGIPGTPPPSGRPHGPSANRCCSAGAITRCAGCDGLLSPTGRRRRQGSCRIGASRDSSGGRCSARAARA